MKVSAFSKGCGAVVNDLQLSGMSDRELSKLRGAFTEHGLLFFRDQQLAPEAHLSFAKRFGDIVLNKFFKPVEGQPQIAEVRKEKTQEMNIGGGWHTDHSYDEVPAMGSILVARELPASGGDTHGSPRRSDCRGRQRIHCRCSENQSPHRFHGNDVYLSRHCPPGCQVPGHQSSG